MEDKEGKNFILKNTNSKSIKPKYTIAFIIVTLYVLSAAGFAGEVKFVRIVDEQGNKVKSFQCMVRWRTIEDKSVTGSLTWKKSKTNAGVVNIDVNKLKESSRKEANGLEMLLQADGYGPEFLRCRFEQIPAEIKLEKSVTVILEKKNKAVAGKPVIVPGKYIKDLLYPFVIEYPLKLKKVNSGKWECDLKKGREYVIGWKAKEGWFAKKFHGYCSEPFVAEQDGQIVNFEPGMPVTFKYDLSKVPKFLNIEKYPVIVRLDKAGADGGNLQFSFSGEGTVEIKQPGIGQIPNLAAGTYYLTAHNWTGNYAIPQISDKREITIKPGKECRIEPVYPVLDTTVEPGDVKIKGIVLDAKQNPIANEQVSLWMQRFDENKRLVTSDIFYKSVKTDSEGKFEFKGVLAGQNIQLHLSNRTESMFLARNSLKENAEINVSFVIGQKAEFITVGKPFIFPIVRLENDKKKNLQEFKGKIIVLDIWASWCSPCIHSMPKLSELAKKIRSEDIQFITLSTDADCQAWKEKLAENEWQPLLHTWLDNTINEHELQKGRGIPFYVIIDREGIVRAAGNGINIKSEIEKIL